MFRFGDTFVSETVTHINERMELFLKWVLIPKPPLTMNCIKYYTLGRTWLSWKYVKNLNKWIVIVFIGQLFLDEFQKAIEVSLWRKG